MALDTEPDTLLRLQTEITVARAQRKDLHWRVRQRRLCARAGLEATTIARAHRIRDQLLTAPARHSALLAARYGLAPGALAAALDDFVRAVLREIAAGPKG